MKLIKEPMLHIFHLILSEEYEKCIFYLTINKGPPKPKEIQQPPKKAIISPVVVEEEKKETSKVIYVGKLLEDPNSSTQIMIIRAIKKPA